MKMTKLSEKLSISAVVLGFWRLEDWKWNTDQLVEDVYKRQELAFIAETIVFVFAILVARLVINNS